MRIVTFFVAASVSLLLSCGTPYETEETDNPNAPPCGGSYAQVSHEYACNTILPRLHAVCGNLNETCDALGGGANGVCCSDEVQGCLNYLDGPKVDCSEAEDFCVHFMCAAY